MAKRSRKHRMASDDAAEFVQDTKNRLWKHEKRLQLKRKVESKYGNELSDLNRLIDELNQSIPDLPEGVLKAASIERLKELESRKQNLVLRYPKGTEISEELILQHIAMFETQLVQAQKTLEDILQKEAQQIAEANQRAEAKRLAEAKLIEEAKQKAEAGQIAEAKRIADAAIGSAGGI